jgi:hypothetical protein
LVQRTPVCDIAANMISIACHHCRREAHFIGNPLFQLVSPGTGHLSFRQKGVPFTDSAIGTFQSETNGNYYWPVFPYKRAKMRDEIAQNRISN